MNFDPSQMITGFDPFPREAPRYDSTTEKEKADKWFERPLREMRDDDAFVCLMICFAMMEVIIRKECEVPDKDDVVFSDNSKALHWFAKFMTIPVTEARAVWDAFRNGLLHRAMVKGSVEYELSGKRPGRVAEMSGGRVTIFVWELRDKVAAKIAQHHRTLWEQGSHPFPRIYFNA